jgi:iron-sulfur cluster repair protein YtfE (RIC family)
VNAYLENTLPTLQPLLAKVAAVHGPQDHRLEAAHRAFLDLRALLERAPDDGAAAAAPLARLRLLTDDFTPPDHACRSYRLALALLADLEDSLLRRTTHGATR